MELTEKLAAAHWRWHQEVLQYRELRKRLSQRQKLAWSCQAQSDAAGETLEVQDAFEFFANFAANDSLLHEMSDGIEAGFNGGPVDERTKKPRSQEPSAHAGDCGVQGGNQGRRATGTTHFFGENRRQQFEVANRNGVQDESIVLLIITHTIEMSKGFGATDSIGFPSSGAAIFVR
jgi:hypothetical protein